MKTHKELQTMLDLEVVSVFNNTDRLEELLEEINIESCDNRSRATPLILASIYGNVEAVKLLLQRGANIDAKDKDGLTPIGIASWNGSKDHMYVVKMLVDKKFGSFSHSSLRNKLDDMKTYMPRATEEEVLEEAWNDSIIRDIFKTKEQLSCIIKAIKF